MEQIIKKAIEGGYNGYPKPFCIECGNYEAPSENTKSNNMFLDPLFWQALGKACGWDFSKGWDGLVFFRNGALHPSVDYALRFHEINLTEGWDKAITWLEELVVKERK